MLYIFHVDTGTMMTFDMNLALENVVQLKDAIERTCRIPTDKQVLLVSGGESLDPSARVCSYSAGTDTNPIYLFSKSTIEGSTPPAPSCTDSGSDLDLKEQVEGSLSMPATYNTVVVRCQLAQQFCELAREQTRLCERLVHDQHLQQQGWSAVVANLEDITVLFRSHAELFEESFKQYLGSRHELMMLVESFSEDLLALSKIPIIPVLLRDPALRAADAETAPKVDAAASDDSVKIVAAEGAGGGGLGVGEGDLSPVTLLQWISVADDQSNLEEISDACTQGLKKFDEAILEELKEQILSAFEGANKTDYKEIKGLEERLFGLEQLMFETKHIVQEQTDLAQSFLQNQSRASNLGDPSILPDLCASHRRQLQVMLKNHQQLRDIRRRCSKAKEELCINLYHRLRWIMYVENNMFDLERRLNLYHDGLKRLRRRLNVVQQIHLAPSMYLTAVGEVVRRRTFSQAFLMWASDVACQLLAVHSDEVTRRQEFQAQFDGHFLNVLFPGMEDTPPPFATQAPHPFDTHLPALSAADIDLLKTQIPDLVASQQWPDLAAITHFFQIKVKTDSMNERLVKSMAETDSANTTTTFMTTTLTHPDSRGFESGRDAEDFEKVAETPMDVGCDSKHLPLVDAEENSSSAAVVAALEESLSAARCEVLRLRGLCTEVGRRTCDTVSSVRDELRLVRAHGVAQRDMVLAHGDQLMDTLDRLHAAHRQEKTERESRHRLTVDQELEMEMLKKEIKMLEEVKEEELRRLKQSVSSQEKEMNDLRADMERRLEEEVRERRDVARSLETELNETRQHCTQLQIRLEASELEKERAVKETADRLAHDYKTELESLRSRFRLMANAGVERSPSDSCLDSLTGRPDLMERTNHEAALARLREEAAREREEARKSAREEEAAKWEQRLEQELKMARCKTEQEKQVWFNEAMRRVVGDKDRQLEALRARESSLVAECQQHQETIQRFSDKGRQSGGPDSGTMVWPLLDRVEALEAENARLESELGHRERRKKTSESDASCEMNGSVALVPESVLRDAATSPELRDEPNTTQKLTGSTNALIQQGKINIMSCNAGDAVLVVWNEDHANYTILQEMSTLYFLHSDCVDTLGLKPAVEGIARRLYATAEVIEKEYCHAKKSENRYRVPKGTKFYRVKVRPLPKESLMVRSHHHHHHHHQSPPAATSQPGTL